MEISELTVRLKAEAVSLGFDAVGIAPAVAPPGYPDFLQWLEEGRAAGMDYMARHAANRAHPASVFADVRSVIVVSLVYGTKQSALATAGPQQGKVARYAQGADYHRVLWERLDALLSWLCKQSPEIRGAPWPTRRRCSSATSRLAGIGWIGKNTMLINKRLGSYTFLGALLVNAELDYDVPHQANHCGTCTRCLEACPTQAFAGPYELDARRCISYWTIEHRGDLPEEAKSELDGWVFGCDICQDVCPWNRKAPSSRVAELEPRRVERPGFD